MADTANRAARHFFVDKAEIQRIVREQNEKIGFVPDPTATPERAQEMALAEGIHPQDNLISSGIIAARDGE